MVKNNTGGNKSKGFARKNMTKKDNALRFAKEEGEIYAQAVKVLGGSIASAIDTEGNPLRAHIRGKFRGRGKRDNFIVPNTWLLVGLHDWQSTNNDCDILEVYNDIDKVKLQNSLTHINWKLFNTNDSKTFGNNDEHANTNKNDGIKFSNEDTELVELIASQMGTNTVIQEEDEIDVNDI